MKYKYSYKSIEGHILTLLDNVKQKDLIKIKKVLDKYFYEDVLINEPFLKEMGVFEE